LDGKGVGFGMDGGREEPQHYQRVVRGSRKGDIGRGGHGLSGSTPPSAATNEVTSEYRGGRGVARGGGELVAPSIWKKEDQGTYFEF